MGRIRTIKPEFFKHEELFDAEQETGLPLRLAFAGLWTVCDREGRFEWRARVLKTDVLPYDDVDFARVLDALATRGFLVRYSVGGRDFGVVPGFSKHQAVNPRESGSKLPPPPQDVENAEEWTRDKRGDDASVTRHNLARGEREREREEEREEEAAVARESERATENAAATAARRDPETRTRLLAAMGVGPDGVTGPSRYIGTEVDMIEADKWAEMGISIDAQCRIIAETCARERSKKPTWSPIRFSYFTNSMADIKFAKDKPVPKGSPPAIGQDAAKRMAFYAKVAGA
jgi:hypothetical protein